MWPQERGQPGTDRDRWALFEERRAFTELAALVADPVYYGFGVPRGDGRAVLVLPGLFGSDVYLGPLHTWLQRIGYRPVRSAITFNAGCAERVSRGVEAHLGREVRDPAAPIAIIGHSRGGILGRAIAARLGERVRHLILLGSPVGGFLAHDPAVSLMTSPLPANSAVAEASLRARQLLDPDCTFPDCGCPFPRDLRRPLSERTEVVAICSPADPVVPAWACRVPDGRNHEVEGTHSGLAFNRGVYRLLGGILAERSEVSA